MNQVQYVQHCSTMLCQHTHVSSLAGACVTCTSRCVDTCASQAGMYRKDALDGLKTTLTVLEPSDQVRLFAVDLFAEELTKGFVAPKSTGLNSAIESWNIVCLWARQI